MLGDIRRLLRKIRRLLIDRRNVYVMARDIGPVDQPGDPNLQCSVLDNPDALAAIRDEFLGFSRDSVADLQRRIDQGCLVFVFRKLEAGERKGRIIAYSICQRGIFSGLGVVQKISDEILFGHYFEILPECRARGLKTQLDIKRDQYCRVHGLKKICSVVNADNNASLKANLKSGFKVVGNVTRVVVLKRLVIWRTPRRTIERSLRAAA